MSDSSINKATVLLVGFEDQDNLGLRYLSSSLKKAGHQAFIATFSDDPSKILALIDRLNPDIVGFSLIFQYFTERFSRLIKQLRKKDVTAHFTIGGHYASFEPTALFEFIPELDSIVRFEGEDTLIELADNISSNQPWQEINGIAYKKNDEVVFTAPRIGRKSLDELPWPDREDIDYGNKQFPTASIIGGRGCPWVCSFCSIITFYEGNGTKGRRRRDPQLVVDEIEYLHHERGIRVILWQDDDFLAGGKQGIKWAHEIAAECIRRGLDQKLRWKISCRSDEVKYETFVPLVEAGLTHVYLGVEAGDPDSLKNLNKVLTPEAHLNAGKILRKLNLSFDFGFMLMEPWSTFGMIRNNISFLRDFVGDGASVVGYCRMLPYVGTGVESRLLKEGRLEKKNLFADYQFLDWRLDAFYEWQIKAFRERNHGESGSNNLLRLLLFEAHLDFPDRPYSTVFCERAKWLTAISNQVLLDTLENALEHFEKYSDKSEIDLKHPYLSYLENIHNSQDRMLRADVIQLLSKVPDSIKNRFVTM